MKHSLIAGLAVLLAVTAAEAAPTMPAPDAVQAIAVPRDDSMGRYHQLRRLDNRQLGRPAFRQGATCVTPTLVCWVPQAGDAGETCSCATPSRGKVAGTIEG